MNFLQQLKSGLTTFLEPSKIISIIFFVAISVFLLYYSGSKINAMELMTQSGAEVMQDQPSLPPTPMSTSANTNKSGYKQYDVANPT